jgi:hypothetical protein
MGGGELQWGRGTNREEGGFSMSHVFQLTTMVSVMRCCGRTSQSLTQSTATKTLIHSIFLHMLACLPSCLTTLLTSLAPAVTRCCGRTCPCAASSV